MKKLTLVLFVAALAAGCGSTPKKPSGPPDPATFEELSAADYYAYKSNVAGKVINEWRSPDGLWQYGQYVVKRALDPDMTFELEREIDLEIMRRFKVRVSALEDVGAEGASIEAKITSVSQAEGRITIDRGAADGVRAGCYMTALAGLSEGQRGGLFPVMDRYYYERIKDAVAMFVVEQADEHAATLKILQRRSERGWQNLKAGGAIFTGFMPQWKHEILHEIPYAVEELPRLVPGYTKESTAEKIAEFLATRYDGDKTTIDEMLNLLENKEEATRKVVVLALRRITGREFGYSPEQDIEKNRRAIEQWRNWWAGERSSFEAIIPKKEKKGDSENDRLHDRGWGPQ